MLTQICREKCTNSAKPAPDYGDNALLSPVLRPRVTVTVH